MQISVKIEGLERLQAGVASGPATLASETRLAMAAGSLLVEGTQRSLVSKDTGRTGGSITHLITGSGANLTSKIGPSVATAIYLEKGRKPGKMPPVKAIEPWARRHGINPYMLARSIGRKGTKPHPFVAPSLDPNRAKIIALFEKVGVKVVNRMAN